MAAAAKPTAETTPVEPLPSTWRGLDETAFKDALRSLAATPPSPVRELNIIVRGHLLGAAASFAELLSPSSIVGVTPHRYQHETVERVLRVLRGRALLADEVGLGKTIEAILLLREYQLRGMARRVLIVVPTPLVAQWVGELEAKAGIVARVVESVEDVGRAAGSADVVVVGLTRARTTKTAEALQRDPWDLVIVDEAHHIKNRSTLGWKLVDGLRSRFLLLLTATPIETDLEELYNLVTLLKPGQFTTPAAFQAAFVDKKNPTSPKNREKLKALLGEVMIRNTRAQSGLRLPPREVMTHLITPHPEEAALYDAVVHLVRTSDAPRLLRDTLLLEAGSSPAAVLATVRRAQLPAPDRRALLEIGSRVITSSKLDAVASIAKAHDGHVLVFSRFTETVHAIVATLRETGLSPAQFSGGMSRDEKQAALRRFEETRCPLVCTDVGAEGQNLQHCNVLVNVDIPWNPMLIEQRIGRLHRMGQTRPVTVYNLAALGTAEEQLLDVLDRRVQLFELVVGEMDMVLGNIGDDRSLEARILDLYAESASDDDLNRGFDVIANELLAARGHYERARALDAALFGDDFVA